MVQIHPQCYKNGLDLPLLTNGKNFRHMGIFYKGKGSNLPLNYAVWSGQSLILFILTTFSGHRFTSTRRPPTLNHYNATMTTTNTTTNDLGVAYYVPVLVLALGSRYGVVSMEYRQKGENSSWWCNYSLSSIWVNLMLGIET